MPDQVDNPELVLVSANTRPRLKWTRQLHESFVDAVSRLGGAHKATPRSVMRVMGIPGITLYHLKSHLQKYRLSKSRGHKPNTRSEDADFSPRENNILSDDNDKDQKCMLQLQMEVQMRLREQIEVQKHLQMRIEAQGKYLQSVLRKAQETLAVYSLNPHSLQPEAAKAELSELISAVDNNECQSSTVSVQKRSIRYADCSMDSCLTSWERAEFKKMSDSTSDSTAESDELSSKVEAEVFQGEERTRYVHQMEDRVASREEIDLNR